MFDCSVADRVKVIPLSNLDEAYESVLKGELKFRAVIDSRTLTASGTAAGGW